MTEQNHHDPAELDKLAEQFTVLPNDNPASDAKRESLIDKPAFGQVFSDNMAHMTWTKGEGWSDRRIEPYAPLKMDPGASVLHYMPRNASEGLKAIVTPTAPAWLFRPDANAERFQNSAKRLYLPELPIDDFIGSVAALVKRDELGSVRRESRCHMRPFMFASEPFLGVRAPQMVCVIASPPSGPYFPGGVKPVSIWVEETKWFRHRPWRHWFRQVRWPHPPAW